MRATIRLGACALATLLAGAVQAQTHTVLIMDGSYFPSIVYAQTGDTLVFTNLSSDAHTVSGPDDTWTSGPIAVDGSYQLDLTETTPLTFGGTGRTDADAEGGSAEIEMAGEISYDPAPLQD